MDADRIAYSGALYLPITRVCRLGLLLRQSEQVTMSTSVKSLVAKSSPPESVGGATSLDADGISMAATGVQEIFGGNASRMRSMDARKQAKCLIWQFPMR